MNEEYQKELKRAGDVSGLNIPYLIAIVSKINIIAESIIKDLDLIGKEGDKYWYTQEDIDRFLQRFHFSDFTSHTDLPPP